MTEAAAGPRFAQTPPPHAACRKAALAQDRYVPDAVDHALALAQRVLVSDQDAPAAADHALVLASCQAAAVKAAATVDGSVDPGRRRHCDHERPSRAQLGAPLPARL